jgi:glycosyltransferase involved in cell wall biosynthesis
MPWPVLLMARELNLGGSERQMTEMAKALDRSRFEPHVGCFLPEGLRGEELKAAGVPVARFPVHSYKSYSALRGAFQIRAYMRRHGIRLAHTFDYPLNVYGIPVARALTRAVVVSSQRAHRDLTPGLYRPLLRFTDHVADAVVVNCEFLKRHLMVDEKVPESLIRVCYNGIDFATFHAQERPRPEPLRGASLVIGVTCGLRPEKDLPTLLTAFAQVRRNRTGLRLAIVGSGPLLALLEAQASALAIAEDCVFQPATNRIPEWLGAMDIFVLPSRSEALSNSLMEAMACGCCAVASNVGGNPELVSPEQTGLLFEAGDASSLARALERLIENTALRRDFARRGREFVLGNFSLGAAAARMGDIYQELIERQS